MQYLSWSGVEVKVLKIGNRQLQVKYKSQNCIQVQYVNLFYTTASRAHLLFSNESTQPKRWKGQESRTEPITVITKDRKLKLLFPVQRPHAGWCVPKITSQFFVLPRSPAKCGFYSLSRWRPCFGYDIILSETSRNSRSTSLHRNSQHTVWLFSPFFIQWSTYVKWLT